MSIIPNTVCQRCHRKYPSIRSRCPYCGTKKPREVRRSMPESDSAVRGTKAARGSAENVNWQMLISGILLVCIIVAVIAIVSVNVKGRVDDSSTAQQEELEDLLADTTAVPTATPTATPSPTPTVPVTSVVITCYGDEKTDFTASTGDQVQLSATAYPITTETSEIELEWYSTDESVATVEDGLVTVVGSSGQNCYVVAEAPNGMNAKCIVRVR